MKFSFGKSKYKNTRVVDPISGNKFDSKIELEIWHELLLLEKARKISSLTRQNHYDLVVNGLKIVGIRPDFEFKIDDIVVTADAKSMATQGTEFQMKHKLFKAIFGREIIIFSVDYKPAAYLYDLARDRKKVA